MYPYDFRDSGCHIEAKKEVPKITREFIKSYCDLRTQIKRKLLI